MIRPSIATAIVFAVVAAPALASTAGPERDEIIDTAREIAGWTGVEAERVRLDGDVMVISGRDRQDRDVTLWVDRANGRTLDRIVHHPSAENTRYAAR